MLWEITEIVNGSISSVNWRTAGSRETRGYGDRTRKHRRDRKSC